MDTVFKALSDPTRRRVLQLLQNGPLSAGELGDHFDVTKSTMSAHFAVLKDGKSVIYNLKLSVLEEALLGFAHSFGLGGLDAETRSEAKAMPKMETLK